MMARIQDDPRIDPRLKAAFRTAPSAGLPTGPLQALWSADGLEERDYWLTSAPDSNQVAMRFARPAGDEVLPCVYYIHGGGMAMGSAYDARSIPRARMLAKLGCAVASIDFRNCTAPPSEAAEPGHGPGTTEIAPYPAGLNDCMSGLRWVHAHAAELGIDPNRVIVAGVSGGGNLTIALALKAKQDGSLAQLLPRGFYALCPYIAGTWPQDVSHGDFMLGDSHLDAVNNGIFLTLGGTATGSAGSQGYGQSAFDNRDPLAWPGFATVDDLSGLPRCVVSVNECDPLRDEGLNFYRRACEAGVDAQCRQVMGTVHGGDLNVAVLPEVALETCRSIVHFLHGPHEYGVITSKGGNPTATATKL